MVWGGRLTPADIVAWMLALDGDTIGAVWAGGGAGWTGGGGGWGGGGCGWVGWWEGAWAEDGLEQGMTIVELDGWNLDSTAGVGDGDFSFSVTSIWFRGSSSCGF